MTDARSAQDLLRLLSRWPHEVPIDDEGRVRLICHQPWIGPRAYLHCLYTGLSDQEISRIEADLARPIPPRLFDFYRMTNGARLFGGQVSVSGLIPIFNRDPKQAQPICIEGSNRIFEAMRPEWYMRGYFRIGGVSFTRQDEMICGPDDRIVLLNVETGEPLRHYPDIFDCLRSLAQELTQFWTDDGQFHGDWEILDSLLLRVGGQA